jgi:hypothetical protein
VDAASGGPTEEGTEQTIVVDASSAKGVSGGGVFREATGRLLGIVEGYQTASIAVEGRTQNYSVKVPMPGETFVVPIGRVRRFVDDAGLGNGLGRVDSEIGRRVTGGPFRACRAHGWLPRASAPRSSHLSLQSWLTWSSFKSSSLPSSFHEIIVASSSTIFEPLSRATPCWQYQ